MLPDTWLRALKLIEAPSLPIALQWMFPTPLAILIFFAPESPWYVSPVWSCSLMRNLVENAR